MHLGSTHIFLVINYKGLAGSRLIEIVCLPDRGYAGGCTQPSAPESSAGPASQLVSQASDLVFVLYPFALAPSVFLPGFLF